MLHLPILRHGVPYTSLDVIRVPHHRTREPFVEISQANPGLIRRDLRPGRQAAARAALGGIVDPRVAERISAQIDSGLHTPGAREVTLDHRGSPRLATFDGCTYLQPTVVCCDGPDHPLANREFLFPYAAVVALTPDQVSQLPQPMGKTLVVSALTRDRPLVDRLLASPLVDRLNIGAIQTNQISWDQPHEGNLFEHLYARRSFQQSADAVLAAADA